MWYEYVHVRHTHPYNWSSELMPYTVLANCYWVSAYETYVPIPRATPFSNNDYICHVANSCRTYLTNCMGSISCHITPLIINSLGGGHTQTHTHTQTHAHTDVRTTTILRNQARAGLWLGHPWFKNCISCALFLKV